MQEVCVAYTAVFESCSHSHCWVGGCSFLQRHKHCCQQGQGAAAQASAAEQRVQALGSAPLRLPGGRAVRVRHAAFRLQGRGGGERAAVQPPYEITQVLHKGAQAGQQGR